MDVARDVKGLKLAILDLLEEGFAISRVTLSVEDVEGKKALMLSAIPPRKLTPGYYKLGEYLLWLDQHARAGVPLGGTLAAFEADGMCAMDAARAEFEHEHPTCGCCGVRQDNRFVPQCRECSVEFKRS